MGREYVTAIASKKLGWSKSHFLQVAKKNKIVPSRIIGEGRNSVFYWNDEVIKKMQFARKSK